MTQLDGYTALKALLPPKERRGLVLIDPPFEEAGELVRMTEGLAAALKRFASGTYLLWYPIKDEKLIARFHRGILEVSELAGIETPLKLELLVRPARNPNMLNGTGIVVANPPFTLAAEMRSLLPMLANRLGDAGRGEFSVAELTHKKRIVSPPAPHQSRAAARKKMTHI